MHIMKKNILTTALLAAAFAPALALAADPTKPGKSGQDSATKPQQEAPATTAGKSPALDPSKEIGKSSDGTKIANASANKFQGKITAVDRAAKTITINDEKMGSHTLRLEAKMKGVTGAEAASWDELKVGAEVKGVCRKDGGTFHAESLSVVK